MIRFLSAAATLFAALTISLTSAHAVEDTWDYSVQVSSAVQASPAQITLSWPQDTNGTPSSYTVYRKSPADPAWGSGTNLSGSATTYTDNNVSVGVAYEYQVVKSASTYNGYGYIETGIDVPLVDNRGKLILLVDNTMAGPLAAELAQLQLDLTGDGWTVIRHDVSRTDTPPNIKALIQADYHADPTNVKAVFLFGHVPVPYSGQLNPDGHPDHIGAWPADVYYGDIDDDWTDNTVNYVQNVNTDPADAARLTNVPGDGKFDQSDIPSYVELQVGRVDLANMPGRTTWGGPATFPSETELLRKYLNKDHAFRTRSTNPPRRAILGDYFGIRGGEAFAASGFRSFAPLVGASAIRNLNVEFNDQKGVWIPQSSQNDNLLAYACGAGSYTSMSGLGSTGLYNDGTTVEMVNNNVRGVFNLLFGSWLGDWDHEDDFLRSPLVTDYGLVSVWSGRPHWFLHPMGLGETIGYVTQLTQNNNGLYQTQINTAQHRIHIALMGDPTLRLHPVVPAGAVSATTNAGSVSLSWGASGDNNIVGYHVYRALSASGPFARLTSSPVSGTSYTDSDAPAGAVYMVRAVKLESTTSGSYYNGSQGVFWSAATGSTGGATSGGTASGTPSTNPTPSTTGPAADTTAPTVSLSAPASGSTVSGSAVTVSANATDNVGVAGVQFKVDGNNLGAEVTAPPYRVVLDTTSLSNGSHTLGAVARDAAGNMGSAPPIAITVGNGGGATSGGTPSGTQTTTSTSTSSTTSTASTGSTSSTSIGATVGGNYVWFDDALPAGASGYGSGGDGWNWVGSNPAPYSGSLAHQSNLASGIHEHAFNWASTGMTINTGEFLSAWVYLDPANPPAEIMLSWSVGTGDWNHRAYWGANDIPYGTDGTASQYHVGNLPATGQWVQLAVPASALGLEGKTTNGMAFTLYDGRATFDAVGKTLATAPTISTLPSVTVSAQDAYANITDPTDTATLVFTRTGDTSNALNVNFTLGGTAQKWTDYYRAPQGDMPVSITIPAGNASASMTIVGRANTKNVNPETATVTLASDPTYAVGSQNTATLTFGTTSNVSTPPAPSAGSSSSSSNTTQSTTGAGSGDTIWFDDSLPKGAAGYGSNGDGWNWITSNPAPYSGAKAHQTNIASGVHEHAFNWASQTLSVGTGDKLYTYVYIDPANPPEEIMLSFGVGVGDWNHRAYWGANDLPWGTNGTASQYRVGDLPAAGNWVRLEVPASAIGLEGATLSGMSFALYNGRATFDQTGRSAAPTPSGGSGSSNVGGTTSGGSSAGTQTATSSSSGSTASTTSTSAGTTPGTSTSSTSSTPSTSSGSSSGSSTSGGTGSGSSTSSTSGVSPGGSSPGTSTSSASSGASTTYIDHTWVDDTLPPGASGYTNGGDVWNWITSNPTPYSGSRAHQSALVSGLHEHAFNWATAPMTIATGDKLYTYVYLDPANPPSEVMLSWGSSTWDHRAYWGANDIPYGVDGTASQFRAGDLPATGGWVRLEVPASSVALEGASVTGMAFTLYNGQATFDASGVSTAGNATSSTTPTNGSTGSSVTVAATQPYAVVGDLTHLALLTFTRSGSTTADLTVNFNLGGTAQKWTDYRRPVIGDMPVSVTIPAGSSSASMQIWAVANTTGANPETATFTLASTSDSTVSVDQTAATLTLLPSGSTVPSTGVTSEGSTSGTQTTTSSSTGSASSTTSTSSSTSTSSTSNSGGSTSGTSTASTSGGSSSGSSSTSTSSTSGGAPSGTPHDNVWVADSLPIGAGTFSNNGDSWNWVTANPAPYVGTKAHQSANVSGIHDHGFAWVTTPFPVHTGDTMYTYVYLDPANPPAELMIAWSANGTWDHRAYWGANNIPYGVNGAASQYYVGPLPATGGWVRLEVPASAVGLEGTSLTGIDYFLYNGTATWDDSGVNSAYTTVTTQAATSVDLNTLPDRGVSREPQIGDYQLRIISPTVLELYRVTTKAADPATPTDWNFVDSSGNFTAPATSEFNVTVGGQPVNITSIGFRRRVAAAQLNVYDLRVGNSLFLQLASPIGDGQSVKVANSDGTLWPADMNFAATADPMRYSPAIHVNQEGYVPAFKKQAMVGYSLGNLGELPITNTSFSIVDASSGKAVYSGMLTQRADQGWTYSPAPYQQVYQADFSSLTTTGKYQLVVPGLGASLPFVIDDGIAMDFARTYALGLYEQRSGMATTMPFTRFAHAADHTAAAEIPTTDAAYNFTWTCIASKSGGNPTQTAPQLTSPSTQLYPFVNQGTVDVSGGHFDAGDYSKYTIDVALLIHHLMIAVDDIPGAAALDNLGIAESGDGISDIMQEAKWEADYIAKLQDADGGFYFIVYPVQREYEWNVLPENGDQQVVWPKNTSATAAAVAALAQCASSPLFKKTYPDVAASYLAKAKLGWQFLMAAQAKYGQAGAYQKVTFYGDDFNDNDELSWAACELFLATGDPQYSQKLKQWFPDPSDPNTMRWSWIRLSESYGCAIRSYAFAASSGRLPLGQLDASYLAACQNQITLAGDDQLKFSTESAYGTAFPENSKHVMSAGWYFSLDQATDMAVAYQINHKAAYVDALVGNMNYEAGTNPINQAYLAGIGVKREQHMVSQFAVNSRRLLPPDGEPSSNLQSSFSWIGIYGNELTNLSFPSDNGTANVYPFYDRFTDLWNVTTEFVTVNQARAMVAAAFLATQTSSQSTPWKPSATVDIVVPSTTVPVGQPVTLTANAGGVDLTNARIVWEARDQQPTFSSSFTLSPVNSGTQWVEVEISWPDGRRMFGTATFTAQ